MKLLSYHGTIVRRPHSGPGLVHVPLRSADPALEDVLVGEGGVPAMGLPAGIAVEPGVTAGTIRLKQSGLYVCAEPGAAAMVANRMAASIWETFLLLSEMEVVLLRSLLGHGWRRSEVSLPDEPGDVPSMLSGFALAIGGQTIDLTADRPGIGSIAFAPLGGEVPTRVFYCGPAAEEPGELPLAPAPESRRRLAVAGREEFLAHSERALAVPAPPDWFDLPMFADPGDDAFVRQRSWHGREPKLREQRATSQVRRSRGKFVLLQRFCEGILFDEHGTYSEAGYFHTLHTFPPGLRNDNGTIMLDRKLLAQAPRLRGPYAVVFNPHLSNYYHWLVEGMLPLDVMQHELPEGPGC